MKYILTLFLSLAVNMLFAQNIIKCNLGDFNAYNHKVSLYAHSKPNSTELDYIEGSGDRFPDSCLSCEYSIL